MTGNGRPVDPGSIMSSMNKPHATRKKRPHRSRGKRKRKEEAEEEEEEEATTRRRQP
jgi:hypothetical protein